MIEKCLPLANQRGHEPAQECINCRSLKIEKNRLWRKNIGGEKNGIVLCRMNMVVC